MINLTKDRKWEIQFKQIVSKYMIKNGTQFPGADVRMIKNAKEQLHSHSELEIIYVLTGAIKVTHSNKENLLKSNDVMLINMNDTHSIVFDSESLICKISLSYRLLVENIQNGNYLFSCNSTQDKVHSYIDIQNIIKRIMLDLVSSKKKTSCYMRGLIYELLDILIEQFQIQIGINIKNSEKDERLQFIFNYVNIHYQEPLHLEEIAELLYTSKSTISRLFKKETGIYFTEYLQRLRLSYAVKELLETQYPITKVAVDCGFSNPSIFSKVFQEKYHTSPSLYRKKKRNLEIAEESISDKDWKLIQKSVKSTVLSLQEEYQNQNIELYDRPGVEYKKNRNVLVNAGAIYNLTLANFQQHIQYLVEELGFSYVRIWNIFSHKMMILQDSNDLKYNFNLIDQVFDFLINHHMKPFIDFGRRDDIAVSAEKQMVYQNEECIKFASEEAWQRMFSAFLEHIMNRYGSEETEGWIYEFTADMREQNLFYDKQQNISYESIYAYGYKQIKKFMPNASVGGFGAGISDVNRIVDWLTLSKHNGCAPDFVSIMAFPYIHVCEGGIIYPKRVADIDIILDKVEEISDLIKSQNLSSDCKLFITEWNQTLSNRNYLNDSCFRATYIMRCIIRLWNIPDIVGLWMGSDWVSSYYDTSSIVNGGSGMITKDDIKKPVFYVLKFLNRLGPRFLKKGEQYIATKNGKNSYYILCENYKRYSPYYFIQNEDQLDLENLSLLFEDNNNKEVDIKLHDLPEREFCIKRHTIDPKDGSILGEWAKFEYEEQLEKSDIKYLNDICTPSLSMERQKAERGIIHVSSSIKAHEIVLFHIYLK